MFLCFVLFLSLTSNAGIERDTSERNGWSEENQREKMNLNVPFEFFDLLPMLFVFAFAEQSVSASLDAESPPKSC
jgi:hypothetical protein